MKAYMLATGIVAAALAYGASFGVLAQDARRTSCS